MVSCRTDGGASNTFGLDIVYAIPTENAELPSPLHEEPMIQAATIENIIADKLAAANRFKAGNTRMKDYDDLWRISRSDAAIDRAHLVTLLRKRDIPSRLDPAWIGDDMIRMWASHRSRYIDLPEFLATVFSDVNRWLSKK